ncbi:MAG: caspase family protein, partial [Flavobacteriaceae bacterium]|nr:caspase family protein [Flavobacteriaceae bacterium]
VISSSSGLEFAYEGETWNNGVFTYALLEGLKTGNADLNNDTTTTISEIKTYVSRKVNALTKGKQKPNNRALNLELDWSLY